MRTTLHAVGGTVAIGAYVLLVVPLSRIDAARRRRRGQLPRIVWGPVPISNIQFSVRADRLAGYESASVVYSSYRTAEEAGFDRVLAPLFRLPVLRHLVPYGVFVWLGLRRDVFGFFFDGGFLGPTPWWRVELPLLKLAGKRVVAYPYGGDARLASQVRRRGRWNAYTDISEHEEDRDEERVRERLAHFGRWADVILGFADLVEDLPRCDGMILHPFDPKGWEPTPAQVPPPVVVVHAPNHRHYKGTRFLVDAVEALQQDGVSVELKLIEGMPIQEARRVYATAHVIADQFLIGAYGLFAVEGMALGKAVICFLSEQLATYHPEWTVAPIANASPDDLVPVLRRLVSDDDYRSELARRGPEYVREFHSLERLSSQFDELYRRLWFSRS